MLSIGKPGNKKYNLNTILGQIEQYDFFFKDLILGLLSTDQSKIRQVMLRSIIKLKVENRKLDIVDHLEKM